MTLQPTGRKTPKGVRSALFPFEGGGVSVPFPEEMPFCLKSAKESKELEQEAEPSYACRGSGSLGHAGRSGPVVEGPGAHGRRRSIFCFHAHHLAQGFTRIPLNLGQSLLTAQATPCSASRLLKVTGMHCGSEDHLVAVRTDPGAWVVHLSSPSPFEGVPSYCKLTGCDEDPILPTPCFETSRGTDRLRMKHTQDFPQSALTALMNPSLTFSIPLAPD